MASAVSSRKLFVSRLRWTDCSETLRKYFSKFGRVSYANVIFDRENGWSKNYGFVTMENEESVKKIMSQKPHMLQDHEIAVELHSTETVKSNKKEGKVPPLDDFF